MKLSVVIITYNEEENIATCLNSITKIADEIVVVDSFSNDETRNICLTYDRLTFTENKFVNFGLQKQFAVNLASNNWVLSIDADESLSEELVDEIQSLKTQSEDETAYKAYQIRRKTYYQGKFLNFCGMNSERHLRLFDKRYGKFSDDKVHEKVNTDVPCGDLAGFMYHKPYKNLAHHVEKINSYTNLFAQGKAKKKSGVKFKVITKCVVRFLTIYFVKLAVLDGYAGFIWAVMGSYYSFLKYAKLYELKEGF
jgi:glycosyltransferase involved in cell wall biosynthesis